MGSFPQSRPAIKTLLICRHAILLIATLTACGSLTQAARPTPNVVLIVADDLGIGDIQAMGGLVPTPNIDRLLSEAMNFTDVHTPTASCHPTRFALVTGSHAYRAGRRYGVSGTVGNGLTEGGQKWKTLGDVMKGVTNEAGESVYSTSFIGKMHLGLPALAQHGYDDVYGLPSGGQDKINMIIDENAQLITDDNGTPLSDGSFAGQPASFEEMGPLGGIMARRARSFIEANTAVNRPFFLHFNSHSVHAPWVPPDTFTAYDGTEIPVRSSKDLNGRSLSLASATLVELDLQVGYLMNTLAAEGVLDDTIVIFTSDNGSTFAIPGLTSLVPKGHYSAGSVPDRDGVMQRLRGAKLDVFEGGHRVPFIVKWGDGTPQGSLIEPGTTNEQLVSTNDIMATLYDLTGQAIESNQAMDSLSLLPALFDTNQAVRSQAYMQAGPGPTANLAGGWRMDDADGEWTLLFEQTEAGRNSWYLLGEPEDLEAAELYNLSDDPGQMNNLLSSHIRIDANERPLASDLAMIEDDTLRQRTAKMIDAFFSHWEKSDPRTTLAVDYSLAENQTRIPPLLGDLDGDGDRDGVDIDVLSAAIRNGGTDARLDLNADGSVDHEDQLFWVNDVKKTWLGDSNLNGVFDSEDLILVFLASEYEDEFPGNSGWSEGDWNGDGEFGTGDLTLAFQSGGYEQGRRTALSVVPEPSSLPMLIGALLGMGFRRRSQGLAAALPSASRTSFFQRSV
jgi:arylsulfatase A-like enzyme